MIRPIFWILVALLAPLAQAELLNGVARTIDKPVLYRTLGKETCRVPDSKLGNLAKLRSLIDAASHEKILEGRHIMAQVPPLAEYAKISENAEPVLLFEDSSKLQIRKGKEARALRKTIERYCKTP